MRRAFSLLAAAGLAAAALALQGAVAQLQQDGKTISTDLRTVDGTLMVPVKDVAAYLGGGLSVANGTATIVASNRSALPGGTPFQGFGGTAPLIADAPKRPDPAELSVGVGKDADNGGFSLRVLGSEEVKGAYKTTNDPRKRRIGPSLPDDRLVVVRMRIENGTKETRRPPLPSGSDITLFDSTGVGTPLLAFDARPIGDPDLFEDTIGYDSFDAPILAPKGAFEFAAVFSLPKDRTPSKVVIALPPATEEAGGANVTVRLP